MLLGLILGHIKKIGKKVDRVEGKIDEVTVLSKELKKASDDSKQALSEIQKMLEQIRVTRPLFFAKKSLGGKFEKNVSKTLDYFFSRLKRVF